VKTALATGLLCVFATLTIWLEVSYAERCFEAAILFLAAVVVWHGPALPRLMAAVLTVVALWGPTQLITGASADAYETSTAALRWAALAATFVLVYESLKHQVLRQRARTWLAGLGGLTGVLATAQAYTSHGSYFWLFPSDQSQVFGPFQNQNNYAAFIELILPLTLWEGLKPGRYRILWWMQAAVMAASVVAAGSRAGSALVAVEIPAVLIVAYQSKQFARTQVAGVAAKVATAAVLCVAATGWETLEGRLRAANPFVYRREMLHSAITMAKERPWTGFGLGTFAAVYPAYAAFDNGYAVNHAHNDWAEWAAEGGVPFLLLLAAIAGASSVPAIRTGWGLGLVAVYVHGFVDFPMQRTGLVVWVSVVGAVLAAEQRYHRNRRQNHRTGESTGTQRTLITENQLAEREMRWRLEAQDRKR
jgi:O-antigen ligase